MRRNHTELPFLWQIELLKLIPLHPKSISARELKNKLEYFGIAVTKRTIERNLLLLEQKFCLYVNDSSKEYRWSLLPNNSLIWFNHKIAHMQKTNITMPSNNK